MQPLPAARPPAVAGRFYPADPAELRSLVEDLLSRAPDAEVDGEVVALLAPHAGYPYSGQTAAAAYRQVRGRDYDVVVVASPSHYERCGGVSVFAGNAYQTPLGPVEVDVEFAAALADGAPDIHLAVAGHTVRESAPLDTSPSGEHAVEVQLPFLQVALETFRLVPLVMDTHDGRVCAGLADALVRAAEGRRVLLVASSDLYHGEDYDACVSSDDRTLGLIEAFDPPRFERAIEGQSAQACGAGPIASWMRAAAALGANAATVVARTNSTDAVGRRGGYVVGYGAVVFHRRNGNSFTEGPLTDDDRSELGRLARDSVGRAARGQAPPQAPADRPALSSCGGAFVTLWKDSDLRGCIGDIHGRTPLADTVIRMAREAALSDPRFPPVRPDELSELAIEISVLSPLEPLSTPMQVEVGRHGLLVRCGHRQGVLLPEVPVRLGWDRVGFLEGACTKAGLPADAWQRTDTEIWTFTTTTVPA